MHMLPAVRKSVSNKDNDVIHYLRKNFGGNMNLHTGEKGGMVCPCVKVNVPFRVLQPLECSFSTDGKTLGILEPGIYQILFSWVAIPTYSVALKRLDQREPEIIKVFIGWGENKMVDWRVVVPVNKF